MIFWDNFTILFNIAVISVGFRVEGTGDATDLPMFLVKRMQHFSYLIYMFLLKFMEFLSKGPSLRCTVLKEKGQNSD